MVKASADSSAVERERTKYERMWQQDDYRTFSPGPRAQEKLNLVKEFRALGVRTLLDAGCGSGKFMRRILEQHAGEFTIRGFDIAGNCLSQWFAGREPELLTTDCLRDEGTLPAPNDGVVCTDVMEHIPTDRVPAVLRNLCTAAMRCVFFGIELSPNSFGPKVLGSPLDLTVKPVDWWQRQMIDAGLEILSGAVQRHPDGTPMWLYLLCRPAASTAANR